MVYTKYNDTIESKQITNSYVTFKRYFNSGIGHTCYDLIDLIRYIYKNKLKLIIPTFQLEKEHNNSKQIETNLTDYYDLSNITINNKHFKLYPNNNYNKILQLVSTTTLVRENNWFVDLPLYEVMIPYNNIVYEYCNLISPIIGTDYMCIHVRRGDKITEPKRDELTKPLNISNIINTYQCKKIYIMTNKVDELKELKQIHDNIYFYNDFPELIKIQEKDNYLLYCIEQIIFFNAKIKGTSGSPLRNICKRHTYLDIKIDFNLLFPN